MNIRDPNLPFNLTSFRALQEEIARLDAALATERDPLTDERAVALWTGEPARPVLGRSKVLDFARCIERAHGIGTK